MNGMLLMKKSFIFIFLIYFILVPKYKAQNSDTVTLLSDYFLSDLSDSSDEIYIVDKIKHKISLLIKGHGKHKILGDNFNTNYLPKYAIIDGEKNYLLNNEIVLKEIASYSNVILEWDTEIYDCSYMFSDLSDIININLTEFNFKRITNMTCIFCNNKDLQYVEFGNFDSSSVISMEKMFYNCESLISLNFSLDMSNVENINFMFACCKNLNTINFNNYPTLSLKTMDKLFYNCSSLISLDLSNFDISKIKNMESLFYNCNNLVVINLSSFYGNKEYINASYMFYNCVKLKNIYFSKYNSFLLNSIEYMFYNCYELLSLNLSSFDTSSVINMRYMFYNCRSITSIDLSSFNTLKVKNMEYMFYNCYYLTSLNLTNFYALEDINMNYMFYYCYNIKYIDFSKTNLIHINKMDSMFYYCKSLSSLDLQKFETSKVQYMDNVFNKCYNLYQIKNIKFDLSSTNSMLQMFYYCESITSLDLSNLVNSKIPINMGEMFRNCNRLKYIDFPKNSMILSKNMTFMFFQCYSLISVDLTSFDTSSAKTMSQLFYQCNDLISVNLTNFKTSKATFIRSMFYSCKSLTSLDLSSFNTSLVYDMGYMFSYCEKLIFVNLTSFNTSSVNNMIEMFQYCYALTSLDLKHFNVSKVTNFDNMFRYCSSLIYLNIFNFRITNLSPYMNNIFSNINKNFKYCLKDNNRFFNSSNGLFYLTNAIRDCSDNCYSYNKIYIPSSKLCVDDCKSNYLYEYNNECINICPKRTKASVDNVCILLNCAKYYNYEETDCLNELPERYYLKDPILKKIDICPIECKTCELEGISLNLCNLCNNNEYYYPKYNDSSNIFPYIKCYQNIEGYYLDLDINTNNSFFKPCYYSCDKCNIKGDEEKHNCIICKNDYNYQIIIDNYFNCYDKETYYYFDRSINKYYFIQDLQCPYNYNKFISEKRKCIEECYIDNYYKFEFKKKCYDKCPNNTILSENNSYYCEPICPIEKPFEILEYQECVENCKIIMLFKKLCILNYYDIDTNIILDMINQNIISENFNFSDINYNQDILIEIKNTTFIITKENKNIKDMDECEYMLRNYYNISNEEILIKLIIDNNKYEIYYSLNGINLEKLNLSLCNYICREPKCLSCTQRSVFYNLCITCNDNYYPKIYDASNIYNYINCYNNIEGYYLDINESLFKPCYLSCKTCNIKGDKENHNCILCDSNYIYEINYWNYTNCYEKCQYYFYYDNKTNKNYCTLESKCPKEYNKLIPMKNQCIEYCDMDDIYKYEFQKKCYLTCPNNTKISLMNNYYCTPICPEEKPFEIIELQKCINKCSINEIINKSCRLNYEKNTVELMTHYLVKEIEKGYFNYTNVYNGENIIINNKNEKFIVTFENITDVYNCEIILRNYYNIPIFEKILKLKIDYIEDKNITKNEYSFFYKLDNYTFSKLDSSICTCKMTKCSLCSNTSLKYNLCLSCNENYYPKINDNSNINNYINCYNNIEGYYLDRNESLFKPCYLSCKTCDIKGDKENHNCILCDSNYIYEFNYQNYSNCYEKCQYYFYHDNKTNKNYCTLESKCPKEYNKLIPMKNQCIEYCDMDDKYKYEFQKKCYSKCPKNTERKNYYCNIKCPKEYPFEFISTQECVSNCNISDIQNKLCIINYQNNETESIAVFDGVVNNIRQDLTSGFDTSNIDKGENIVIEEKGIKLTITNTENQKNSEKDKNSTSINLGECETKLKEHYKIPLNKALYILKLDVPQEGMKIPKIEYEVYYNLDGKNLEKLDLSVCKNTKVDIYIPVVINEDFDKLNTSSAYFNDICYTSSTNNGTDIILSDRKKEFIDNNKTICEENCDFTKYDYETGKAICSCNIKINIPLISKITINKNKLFDSFTDINNIINYKIMKCYKILFTKNGFSHNYGSFILIPLFIFHIISIIISWVKGIKSIKNEINEIISAKINYEFSNDNNIHQTISDHLNQEIKNQNQNNSKTKNNNITKIKKRKSKKKGKINKKTKSKVKSIEIDNKVPNRGIKDNSKIIMNQDQSKKELKLLSKNNEKCNKYKKILEPNESELNCLPYEKAKKLDKRTYCQFYFSLLKVKHLLLFSFVNTNDYNIRIIKIDLFFINFTINYTVNALFFNDKTMHQIYEDSGEFNFIYQIPQILYSSLISIFLFTLLKLFALTENKVLEIKHKKEKDNLKEKKADYFKIINIKIILFDITSIIMLLTFFYYIACFCAIYINTQIYLIKDTLVSFGISLLYPFFVYLISGIFRIPSLKDKKNERETMYNISKLFQML